MQTSCKFQISHLLIHIYYFLFFGVYFEFEGFINKVLKFDNLNNCDNWDNKFNNEEDGLIVSLLNLRLFYFFLLKICLIFGRNI